ncbi:MAG: LPS-assembly lipoprotein [Sphingomonadales bacterium]|nr:LPS-assembly lipoprotein [Sphingomonadales bacterium]
MRILAPILAALALCGCGLHPLYGGGSESPVAATMRSITVASIQGQSGWLVRNKLVDRFGQPESGTAAYRLDVTLDDNITAFGLSSNQAATQERRTLRARYQLVDVRNGMVVLDATAGSDAGIDIVGSAYATVAAEQTALENLADIVADQITARVALYASRTAPAK